MKQIFGAILILGALAMGYAAFRDYQALNSLGGFGDIIGALGGPTKQDAIVKGVISVVALVIGIGFLDGD